MLTTKKTIPMEFCTAAAALEYVNGRVYRRHLIETHNLEVDKEGTLTHNTSFPKAFSEIPLTDIALGQINSLVGISKTYSDRIDPNLHAYSINKLLKKLDATVTVVVESSRNNPDNQRIAAFLPGACSGIDDVIILERLEFWNMRTHVRIKCGQMDVLFGNPDLLEVLPGDEVQINGALHNLRWGHNRATVNPTLEASVFWKRLICSNGAYINRVLAKGRLMNLASRQEAARFVDLQVERIRNFQKNVLKQAVARMSETIPNESDYEEVTRIITRLAGAKTAEELLKDAVSWWDHFNAVTAAANVVDNVEKQRKLQIEGGAMLERFLV